MPIEFSCDACNRLLRVPDGSEGSQCECPACKTLLEIPGAETPVLEVAPADNRLRIECPDCGHKLICDPALEGTKGQCKSCGLVFLVSKDPAKVKASVEQSGRLVFSCPKCEQLFDGDKSMRGRKGKCHACGEVFAIQLRKSTKKKKPDLASAPAPTSAPGPKSKPASAGPERKANQPKAQPATQKAPAPAAAPAPNIQLSCYKCQGVMEVPGSAAGQKTACPYCHVELLIPDPNAPAAPAVTPPVTPTPQANNAGGGLWDSYDQHQANSQNQTGGDIFADVPSSAGGGDYYTGLDDMSGAATDPFGPDPYGQDPYGTDPYGADPYSSGGNAFGNPYESPGGGSYASGSSYAPSVAGTMSFGNVFSLFFDRAFPNVALSSLIYLVAAMVIGGATGVALIVVQIIVGSLGLDQITAITILGIIALLVTIVGLYVSTYIFSMMAHGALATIRHKQVPFSELLSTGDAAGRMTGFWLIMTLTQVVFVALFIGISMLLGPNLAGLTLLIGLMLTVVDMVLLLSVSLAPYAIIDGANTFEAIQESIAIYSRNFVTMTAASLCGAILVTIIVSVTFGFGNLLLTASPFYFSAAMYELGRR